MRHFLFLPFLLAASFAFSQSKTPDQYAKNLNAPAAMKRQQADCYVRKLDAGTSALRRGDYRVALRLFEEAKTCPEAISSSRRIKELETRIEFCNTKLGRNAVAESDDLKTNRRVENIETTGRKFNISPALKKNTDPNCFTLTVKEADRAFRDSCWDDAAKLYRAAKTCADANQLFREQMNTKIEACRAAAEDELLQKEQKAIRTARHALAANLANDAGDLLRKGDRTMAWRLADFANFYIAPDDNPQCLEAMYGSYYYDAQAGDGSSVRPPFCYQLSEDLSTNVQFKFFKNKSGEKLTAFLPAENRTISWELPSMKIIESFSTEGLRAPIGFNFSPDGSLMFYGENYFYLPNGQTKEVLQISQYCFSEDGDLFFYHDVASGAVLTINLNQSNRIQQQQQRKSTSNIGRINPIPSNIPVEPNLLSMKAYKGELWLAYPDRVEVLARDKTSGAMHTRLTWHFADTTLKTATVVAVRVFPETREALVTTIYETYYFFLNQPLVDTNYVEVSSSRTMSGRLMDAVANDDQLLVMKAVPNPNTGQDIVSIFSPGEPTNLNQFNAGDAFAYSPSTALSPGGDWIVCQDGNSVTRLWSLKDTCAYTPSEYILGAGDYLSPDGNRLFSNTQDTLQVFDTDDLAGGVQLELPLSKNNFYLPLGNTNKWAVGMTTEKELTIQQLTTRETRHFEVLPEETIQKPFAFDETEARYFAYSPGDGMVIVKSLNGQNVLASRVFDGSVSLLRCIPGTDQLLVVIHSGDRFTVKVWNFSAPGENPRVVRLQGYTVLYAQVSEQGNRIALSSGDDIRIFLLDNLDDESVVIKAYKNSYITDFAFRPDGLALALSDGEGRVMIYDAITGQSLLRFSNMWEGVKFPVNRLAFAYGGTRLRLVANGRLFTINLDAYSLREVVQSGDRQLVSFTTSQIRDYNLEIAFKYAGNFDRLAESEDYPLIRSFFQYFRDQSQSSNNMEQVRTYCERAFKLYELLDATGQANLEVTMFQMYENYILKLLLRNADEEASRVVMHLEKHFGRPNVAIITAAHCSLARHDLKAASRLYTDYLLRLPNDGLFMYQLEDINTKVSQFQEYDLLDTTQVTCLCEVFQQFPSFSKLCPASKKYTMNSYSKQVSTFQQVYMGLDSISYIYALPAEDKVQGLENIVALAHTLDYPNPVVEKHPLEVAEITLADAYIALAVFEQNSPKTPGIYQKAIDLLEKPGPFTGVFDTARLSRLVNLHLLYGNYHLENDKPSEAVLQFNAGLTAGKKLMARYPDGTLGADRIGVAYLSPLYLALGRARLLEGKSDDARKAFEQAEVYVELKRENVLNGHAALLENNEIEAFLAYGSIETAGDLGEALFQINQMAELLPMQRPRLQAFMPRLRDAYLANHPTVTVQEVNYWQSTFQVSRYATQTKWDSTFSWSSTALRNINTLMARPDLAGAWLNTWFDQSLSNAYYLLISHPADTFALSEVVRYTNEVLQYITTNNQYYQYRNYYYSNLGHALWLRNRPGDRERAVDAYHTFLIDPQYDGSWELLIKDFIDLRRAGVRWQNMKNLIQQIIPEGKVVSPETWRELGE